MPTAVIEGLNVNYVVKGSGPHLLMLAPGGFNSIIEKWGGGVWGEMDALNSLAQHFTLIAYDRREAGASGGRVEKLTWAHFARQGHALLDHLGVDKFFVMGFCIGNPLIWNLLQRAPGRIVAAVSAQPSGVDPKNPKWFYNSNIKGWAPKLIASRPEINMGMVERFLEKMYGNVDFVLTATRDFVRNCHTPLLVLPDDTEAHVYAVAMEMVHLAPNAQVSLYPWKDTRQHTAMAVRHVRSFLRANCPAA